jgi:hypothetical protein
MQVTPSSTNDLLDLLVAACLPSSVSVRKEQAINRIKTKKHKPTSRKKVRFLELLQ